MSAASKPACARVSKPGSATASAGAPSTLVTKPTPITAGAKAHLKSAASASAASAAPISCAVKPLAASAAWLTPGAPSSEPWPSSAAARSAGATPAARAASSAGSASVRTSAPSAVSARVIGLAHGAAESVRPPICSESAASSSAQSLIGVRGCRARPRPRWRRPAPARAGSAERASGVAVVGERAPDDQLGDARQPQRDRPRGAAAVGVGGGGKEAGATLQLERHEGQPHRVGEPAMRRGPPALSKASTLTAPRGAISVSASRSASAAQNASVRRDVSQASAAAARAASDPLASPCRSATASSDRRPRLRRRAGFQPSSARRAQWPRRWRCLAWPASRAAQAARARGWLASGLAQASRSPSQRITANATAARLVGRLPGQGRPPARRRCAAPAPRSAKPGRPSSGGRTPAAARPDRRRTD